MKSASERHLPFADVVHGLRKTWTVLLLISFLFFNLLASNANADEADDSHLRTTAVGTVPGSTFVDQVGALNHHFPIAVPRGPGGFAPNLSVAYSSNIGNGPLGMGWVLSGLSAIENCNKDRRTFPRSTGINWRTDTDSDDAVFCLDGRRLFRVAEPFVFDIDDRLRMFQLGFMQEYIVNPDRLIEYRLRPDRSIRVLFNMDQDAWLVELPDGSKSVYNGKNWNDADNAWLISHSFDAYGNSIAFHYEEDSNDFAYGAKDNPGGRPLIESIRYGEEIRISFFYGKDRPDVSRGFRAGLGITVSKRLTDIHVYVDGALLRAYRFDYEEGKATGRSRLRSVTLCHGTPIEGGPTLDNQVCMPATEFRYTDRQRLFQIEREEVDSTTWKEVDVKDLPAPVASDVYSNSTVVGDFNGDGRDDLVIITGQEDDLGVAIAFGNPSADDGFDPAVDTTAFIGPAPFAEDDKQGDIALCDTNNDGRSDLVTQTSPNRFAVHAGHGVPPNTSSFLWHGGGQGQADEDETIEFLACADLDGDGFDDVITCEGDSDETLFYVYYRSDGGQELSRERTALICRPGAKQVIDATNDGVFDIVDAGFEFECTVNCPTDNCNCLDYDEQKSEHVNCLTVNLPCPCEYPVADLDARVSTCRSDNGEVIATCPIGSAGTFENFREQPEPHTCTQFFPDGTPDVSTAYCDECQEIGGECNAPLESCGYSGKLDSGVVLTTRGVAGGGLSYVTSNFPASFEGGGDAVWERTLLGAADLNADGHPDPLFWKQGGDNAGLEVAFGVGGIGFGGPTRIDGFDQQDSDSHVFVDVNGDARDDLFFAPESDGTLWYASYQLTGGIATSGAEHSLETAVNTFKNTEVPYHGRPLTGDFNGDGVLDIAMCKGCRPGGSPTSRWFLYRGIPSQLLEVPSGSELPSHSQGSGGGPADLLTWVRNGLGETRFAQYRSYDSDPEAAYCQDPFFCNCPDQTSCGPVGRPVVHEMSVIGGPSYKYAYRGELHDRLTGRNLGPEQIEITQNRGAEHDPWISLSEFRNAQFDSTLNDFPFAGLAYRRTLWRGKDDQTNANFYTRTVIDYTIEPTVALDSNGLSEATLAAGPPRSYFVYPESTTVRTAERKDPVDDWALLDSALIPPVTEFAIEQTRERDDQPNVTELSIIRTDTAEPQFTGRTTQSTWWEPDVGRWALRKPRLLTVQGISHGDIKGKTTQFTYADRNVHPNEIIQEEGDPQFERRLEVERDDHGNILTTTRLDTQSGFIDTGTDRRLEVSWDQCNGRYPSQITNAEGHQIDLTWDCLFGALVDSRNEHGAGWAYGYDLFGRQIRETNNDLNGGVPSDAIVTEYERTAGGDDHAPSPVRIRSRRVGGAETYVEGDKFGRVVETGRRVDGKISATRVRYDTLGRAIEVSGPNWNTTPLDQRSRSFLAYDNRNRVVSVEGPSGLQRFEYDGLSVTKTIGGGLVSSVKYNDLNQPLMATIGAAPDELSSVCYEYGAFEQLEEVLVGCHTSQPRNLRTFIWNSAAEYVTSIIDQVRGTSTAQYNAFGELTSLTDADGIFTEWTYSRLGQPRTRERSYGRDGVPHSEHSGWFYVTPDEPGFGPPGALKEAVAGSDPFSLFTRKEYIWDPLGRPKKTILNYEGEAPSERTWTYDQFGRVDAISHSGEIDLPFFAVGYAYDNNGVIGAIFDANSQEVFWSRKELNAAGQVLGDTLGNGVERKFAYDKAYRLRKLQTDKEAQPIEHLTLDTYWYDLRRQLEQHWDLVAGQRERFFYDSGGRLRRIVLTHRDDEQLQEEHIAYDVFNNIKSRNFEAYEASHGGKVSRAGVRVYTHNNSGHVIGIGSNVEPTEEAAFPTPVELPVSISRNGAQKVATLQAPGKLAFFDYDADDERVLTRWITNGKIWLDDGNYRRKRGGIDSPIHRYRIALGGNGAVVFSRQKTLGLTVVSDESLAVPSFEDELRYVSAVDVRGSALAITDADGAFVQRRSYDVTGAPRNPDNWFIAEPGIDVNGVDIGFTGQPADSISGLVDFGARWLDTRAGIMLSPDPIVVDPLNPIAHNATQFGPSPLLIDPTGNAYDGMTDTGEPGVTDTIGGLFSLGGMLVREAFQLLEQVDNNYTSRPKRNWDRASAPKPQMSIAGSASPLQALVNDYTAGIATCDTKLGMTACEFNLPRLEESSSLVGQVGQILINTYGINYAIGGVEDVLNIGHHSRLSGEYAASGAMLADQGNYLGAAGELFSAKSYAERAAASILSIALPLASIEKSAYGVAGGGGGRQYLYHYTDNAAATAIRESGGLRATVPERLWSVNRQGIHDAGFFNPELGMGNSSKTSNVFFTDVPPGAMTPGVAEGMGIKSTSSVFRVERNALEAAGIPVFKNPSNSRVYNAVTDWVSSEFFR